MKSLITHHGHHNRAHRLGGVHKQLHGLRPSQDLQATTDSIKVLISIYHLEK